MVPPICASIGSSPGYPSSGEPAPRPSPELAAPSPEGAAISRAVLTSPAKGSIRPSGQSEDEGAIDLEDVDGEAVQIAQRRVAGAEVVEHHPDPEPAQLGQRPGRHLGVFDQGALGDLEGDVAGLETGSLDG